MLSEQRCLEKREREKTKDNLKGQNTRQLPRHLSQPFYCWKIAREGAIIIFPLKGQFPNACDVIITTRTAVSELVDNNNNAWPIVVREYQ